MGWLELIALMKRVLPLLSSVAPMLESYVGARGGVRGDAEAIERLSGDLKAQLAGAVQNHVDLKDSLDTQSQRLQQLVDELQRMRAADVEKSARLETMERNVTANTRLLRTVSAVTLTLLFACIGLLIVLLLRH